MSELTRIGSKNAEAFAFLMPGHNHKDYAMCIGAIEEDEAAGVALYNTIGDALMLDYMFVAEKFRRRGIGTALLEEFLTETEDAGAVAVHVNFPESSEDIYNFFLSRGFRMFRDGKAYNTPVSALVNSSRLNKLMTNPQKNMVRGLDELSGFERSVLIRSLDAQDMDEHIIDDTSLSKELSLVTIDRNSALPSACVLCKKGIDHIAIIYMVNFTKDPFQLVDLLRVLRYRAVDMGLLDHELIFVTMDDDMYRLPEKLLGGDELLVSGGDVISAIRMIKEN